MQLLKTLNGVPISVVWPQDQRSEVKFFENLVKTFWNWYHWLLPIYPSSCFKFIYFIYCFCLNVLLVYRVFCYHSRRLSLIGEKAFVKYSLIFNTVFWCWASRRTAPIVSVAITTDLLVGRYMSLDDGLCLEALLTFWMRCNSSCSSVVRVMWDTSASTSRAALWPACTAPSMYPHHWVAVSVPAQCIL